MHGGGQTDHSKHQVEPNSFPQLARLGGVSTLLSSSPIASSCPLSLQDCPPFLPLPLRLESAVCQMLTSPALLPPAFLRSLISEKSVLTPTSFMVHVPSVLK